MTSELLKKLEDEKKAKEAEEVAAKKKAALEIKPIFPATTGKILLDCKLNIIRSYCYGLATFGKIHLFYF